MSYITKEITDQSKLKEIVFYHVNVLISQKLYSRLFFLISEFFCAFYANSRIQSAVENNIILVEVYSFLQYNITVDE